MNTATGEGFAGGGEAPGLGELFDTEPQVTSDTETVDSQTSASKPGPNASKPKRPLRLGTPTRTRAVPAGVEDLPPAVGASPDGDANSVDHASAAEGQLNGSADATAAWGSGVPATLEPVAATASLRDRSEPEQTAQANTATTPQPSIADIFTSELLGPGGFPMFSANAEDPAAAVITPNPAYAAVPQQAIQQAKDRVLERRFEQAERYWPLVDRIMTVAGSDVDVQRITGRLELIADAAADAEQRDALLYVLKPKLAAAGIQIPDPKDIPIVLEMAYDEMVGISVLGSLWRDPAVTEIMVDRWNKVTLERDGKLEDTPICFRDPDHANSVARSLALRLSDRAVSRSINLVTAELPSARVQFAYGPVVRGGLSITIRKFRKLLGLDDLLNFRAINHEMIDFLQTAVRARAGILISGGTGTGKTTIINLLSNFIPTHERVITIEDAFELRLANSHVVSLQTKEAASADDAVSVTLADLLRATLRMRPDRIIVGEIREGDGASVMLTAANTGHEGTMTTIHANSVDMALNERLVDLLRQSRSSTDEAILRTIASAFDLVVQVSRGRRGNRYISEIAVVERSGLRDGILHPIPLFIGEDDESGGAQFRRVGSLGPDTVLGRKFVDAGVETSRWFGQEG